jgi:hypothetical protein
VHNWKITEHWGVANLFSLVQQFAHSHWRHEADRWLIIPTAKISFGD